MKKSRYTKEQIVRILRETDRESIAEVAKRNGVSEASIYAWQKRFGEMEANDVRQMKELQSENARLKKLLAERDLAIEVMKEINAKNGKRTSAHGASLVCYATGLKPKDDLYATANQSI